MNRRTLLAAAAAGALAPASTRAQVLGPDAPRFAAAAAYSAEHDGASFLVARHGVVLAEHYVVPPDTRLPIGAGAKMFSTLLAASLIEDGLMRLDEAVATTFPEWSTHPTKSFISIRGLLNGTCGLAIGDDENTDIFRMIAMEPVATPGERFIDDPAPYLLLGEIARRKLERAGRQPDPAAWLTNRTLETIGCVPIGWTRGPAGAAYFHDGILLSARCWAQAGELVRRRGVWRARQLADDGALREAMFGSYANPRAGMGFWLAAAGRDRDRENIDSDLWRMNPPPPADLAMAAGDGGQRLYVIPSLNAVIVRQSQRLDARGWSDAAFLALVLGEL